MGLRSFNREKDIFNNPAGKTEYLLVKEESWVSNAMYKKKKKMN